jgi:lipopolysaccharide export system protein LptA
MYKPSFIQSLSVVITLCLTNSVAAQLETESSAEQTPAPAVESTISNDFNLPVTLDSKSQALDGKNKTSIFTDSVVIRQGSLELLADKVEVNAAQGTGKEIIIATGQPASYKQRKDDGTMVEASANEIIYKVEPRTISLNGEALIMQNEVRVTGDLIVFDMTKEQIMASTNEDSADSVRTVISPGAFSNGEDNPPAKEQDENQP